MAGKKIILTAAAFIMLEAALVVVIYFYNLQEANNRKYQILIGDIIAARLVAAQPLDPKQVAQRIVYDTGLEGLKKFMRGEKEGALVNPMETNMHSYEIILGENIPNKSDKNLKQAWNGGAAILVKEDEKSVYVYSKLMNPKTSQPYGILKISSTPGNLFRDIFEENAILYFVIVFLVNLEALIIAVIILRPRKVSETVVFEKGYLKEHAIGALKLQHKILGDIIKDHNEED